MVTYVAQLRRPPEPVSGTYIAVAIGSFLLPQNDKRLQSNLPLVFHRYEERAIKVRVY